MIVGICIGLILGALLMNIATEEERKINERLKKTINHKELGKQVSYQYLMRLEVYKLIKHLIGEKEYEGFKIWW